MTVLVTGALTTRSRAWASLAGRLGPEMPRRDLDDHLNCRVKVS